MFLLQSTYFLAIFKFKPLKIPDFNDEAYFAAVSVKMRLRLHFFAI